MVRFRPVKFVSGEQLSSTEFIFNRFYEIQVADNALYTSTIVARFRTSQTMGNLSYYEFDKASIVGADYIGAIRLIDNKRVTLKNFDKEDEDEMAPIAWVKNSKTSTSKKIKAIRIMTEEEQKAAATRLTELTRAQAREKTARKRHTMNQFKEANRLRLSPKEFNLNEIHFKEGKTYAIKSTKALILATFQAKQDHEYIFMDAKGDYDSQLITDDGFVSLSTIRYKKDGRRETTVFNPETMESAVVQSAPTLIDLSEEQLDKTLSDASSEGVMYHPKKRIKPYKPSNKTRAKSTLKIRPVPTSVESFLTTARDAAREVTDLAYSTMPTTTELAYLYLMKKYKSRCVIAGELEYFSKKSRFEEGDLTYYIPSKKVVKKATAIGDELKKCVERGVSAVFIPFTIHYYKSDAVKNYRQTSHANMLIYRPQQNIVERFEPSIVSDNKENVVLKKFFEQTLQPKLGDVQFKFPQEEMNAALKALNLPPNKGLQELEMEAEGLVDEEGDGYCQMWSLFIMECILINPEMSTEAIIRQCYEVSKADPQYLRDLIRGYVQIMSTELEKDMGKKADIKRVTNLKQRQRTKIAHLAEALAALRQKRHARTHKNEGSASSHSSAFKDSSGYSTEMELP